MFNKLFKRKSTKIEDTKNTTSDNVSEKEEANELSFKLHYRNENGELCELDPWDEDAFNEVMSNKKNRLVFM
nr:MAG TPA: hypothetical protein [Caudoviricetes sp.]